MKNTEELYDRDTQYVLSREYTRNAILFDIARSETPIFDSLAADRFASDRASKVENPAERRNHEFDRLDNYEEFNLGDYR